MTIMAERDAGPYDGAVVFDATLYAKEANSQVGLSLLPRIPLLFVATLREAAESKGYLTALVARPPPVVPPALFLISREGHDNINQPERLFALRALNAWIERGPDALPARRTRRVTSTRRSRRIRARRRQSSMPAGAASTAGSPRSTRSTATCSSRRRAGISRTPASRR